MSNSKKSLRSLLSAKVIDELALPSNVRYGKAIHKRGGVEFISATATEVSAWVGGLKGSVVEGGSQRRRTRLFVRASGKLGWHCSGNPKNHQVFCKHCVALALATLRRRAKAR